MAEQAQDPRPEHAWRCSLHVIAPVPPKKKEETKWMKAEKEDEEPLADPIEEKLRRQR